MQRHSFVSIYLGMISHKTHRKKKSTTNILENQSPQPQSSCDWLNASPNPQKAVKPVAKSTKENLKWCFFIASKQCDNMTNIQAGTTNPIF